MGIAYLSLGHVLSVQPLVEHTAVEVDGPFRVQLLQNPVQSNEGPGATNSGAETRTDPGK